MITASYTLDQFNTEDAAMRRCVELARVAARTDLPVLILGESGTGKTMLARAVHLSSARAKSPFVSFNAAALSDTLIDSQLFGHERGAFTGANRRVKGKFEQAHSGTLFVDEIADMTPSAQAKILRAIEYGEFERLGSEALQVADVRLISATHLPLHRFMESDQFRRDLFYRISGLTINVPPLRERPADLRALIGSEIAAAARKHGKPIAGLSRPAAEMLFAHRWPGNLRELQRVLHTAVAMTTGDVIFPDAVLLEPAASSTPPQGVRSVTTGLSTGSLVSSSASATSDTPVHHADAISGNEPDANDRSLRTAIRRHVTGVLQETDGCKRRAAKALGISRSTLDRKLAQLKVISRTGATASNEEPVRHSRKEGPVVSA